MRQGVRNEIHEHDGSLLVIARHGAIRAQDYLFGGLSEEIVAASPVPVMVVEMDEAPVKRVLLPLRAHDLRASRRSETGLAVEVARRLARRSWARSGSSTRLTGVSSISTTMTGTGDAATISSDRPPNR